MNRNPAEPNPFQFSEITPEQMRQQLEAALRANPRDRKALKELSAWLQQHGASEAEKARGEFIVASLTGEVAVVRKPRHEKARARARELLDKFGVEWVHQLLPHMPADVPLTIRHL